MFVRMFQCFFCILFFFISFYSWAEKDNKMIQFDSNYVHTVYFWLKNPSNTSDRLRFEQSLKKFMRDSTYAKTKFIGAPPKATREVVDDSFTYSLVVTFESKEAQKKYQEELSHKTFVDEAGSLWSKVIVYDSISLKND